MKCLKLNFVLYERTNLFEEKGVSFVQYYFLLQCLQKAFQINSTLDFFLQCLQQPAVVNSPNSGVCLFYADSGFFDGNIRFFAETVSSATQKRQGTPGITPPKRLDFEK
jgi:hypothetical protein